MPYGVTSFDLKDENNENLKIHVNYAGNLPSNFAEEKRVIISRAVVSKFILRQTK